jgi:hypothetical protein
MPELELPLNSNPPKAPPSSTPPGGTPTSATPPAPPATAPTPISPPSASPQPFRFGSGPDVPQWAQGKSAEEVLAIARGYHDTFERGVPNQGTNVPASAAPPQPFAPQEQPRFGQEAMIGNEQHTILTTKDLPKLFAQYVQPALQQSTDLAAGGIYAAMQARHPQAFQKYGPEIQQELAKVPKTYWTLDNLETVVTLVYGRHRDDYAREEAQRLVSHMEPTIRPTGGGSGPVPAQSEQKNPFESESVPADWKVRAKDAGITEATIREFCQANDMTPEDFWKQFDNSPRQPMVAEIGPGSGR